MGWISLFFQSNLFTYKSDYRLFNPYLEIGYRFRPKVHQSFSCDFLGQIEPYHQNSWSTQLLIELRIDRDTIRLIGIQFD